MSVTDPDKVGELSYENIKQLFRISETPVLTAPEIAETFGISTQAANYRVKQLHENGEVGRKRVGSSAVVYWLSDD